jgi:hypothetical protein
MTTSRAAAHARLLQQVMERVPVSDVAAAARQLDGMSYLEALDQTCDALKTMCDAFDPFVDASPSSPAHSG